MRIQSNNQLIIVVVVVVVAPHIQAYWLPTQKLLYTVANPAPRGLLNMETIWKGKTYPGTSYSVKKGSVARVDRRLRRYYLIVRLLPNVFTLACLSLSSI